MDPELKDIIYSLVFLQAAVLLLILTLPIYLPWYLLKKMIDTSRAQMEPDLIIWDTDDEIPDEVE